MSLFQHESPHTHEPDECDCKTEYRTSTDGKITMHDITLVVGDPFTQEAAEGLSNLIEALFKEQARLLDKIGNDHERLVVASALLDTMADSIEAQMAQNQRLLDQIEKANTKLATAEKQMDEKDQRIAGLHRVVTQQSGEIDDLFAKIDRLNGAPAKSEGA